MQESWDFYRKVIEDLYLKDDKTLTKVMTAMEQNYGFRASKSQYDLQFKKWNLRKNLNDSEWKFIHGRLEKRKLQGKESEVYFNNMLVPNKKVKKEISRHVLPTFSQGLSSASSPETPPDVSISTPIAMQTMHQSILHWNLPWFQCVDFVQIQVSEGEDRPWADQIHLTSASSQWDFELDMEATSNRFINQENHIGPVTDQTPQTLLSHFAGLTRPTTNLIEVTSSAVAHLQIKCCERYSGELMANFQCILDPSNDNSFTHVFKLAVYLASNNLLSSEQTHYFLRWLIDNEHHATLHSFLKARLPTSKAFAKNIFPGALRIGDLRTVQVLVSAGVDLNRLCDGLTTPLILAVSSRCTTDIVRILLIGGADINKLVDDMSALEEAIDREAYDVVKLLLDFGADANSQVDGITALTRAAKYGDIRLLRIFLDAGADVNEHARSRSSALYEAVLADEVEIVRLLVEFGADIFAQQPDGTTVLKIASECGTPEMMQVLLGLFPEGFAMTADIELFKLQAAVAEGDTRPVQNFLQKTVDAKMRNFLLWTAVKHGQPSLVRLLLEEGVDVNYEYEYGDSPITLLHEAILRTNDDYDDYDMVEYDDRIEIIRIILAAGADMNFFAATKDRVGSRTPLQAAAEIANLELVKLLLDASADVNAPATKPDGMTALQAAVESFYNAGHESLELVQLLLKVGADVNAPASCPCGRTALQRAVKYCKVWPDHIQLIELLLNAGADVNACCYHCNGTSALTAAAECRDLEVMRLLLRKGGNVNASGWNRAGRTPLQVALSQQNIEMARLLLNAGADVNAQAICEGGRTPLQEAATQGNIEMTLLLLTAGANINAPASWVSGTTALQAAIKSLSKGENLELVSILLIAGANVNAQGSLKGRTALQAAAKTGNLKIVQLLLKEGAIINAPSCPDGGRTALQAAAEEGHSAIIRVLLDEGANVNAPACHNAGRTALQAISIASRCNLEIVQMLLDAGADVNARPARSQGLTALQGAAITGHIQVAIVLLENGADVNAAGAIKEGRTALEGAAEHGRLDMVQLLLNAGADSHKPEESRYLSAIRLAQENEQFETAELLLACRNE